MRTRLCAIGCVLMLAAPLVPSRSDAAPSRGQVVQIMDHQPPAPPPPPRITRPSTPPEPQQPGPAAAPEESPAPEASPEPAEDTTEDQAPPQATGQPPEPADGGPAADAEGDWRPEPSEENILIDADEVFYQAGATVARGNVTVRYREITVTADEAEIDEDGVWGVFHGNVTIRTEDIETTAELIRVNFETEEWEVVGGRTALEPDFFEQGVAEPIYVRAQSITGAEGEEVITAHKGLATSCDLEKPHYGLRSDTIRLIGDDKVVLEKPELRILGNRIFRYPWDVVLSQRSRNNRLFPEFGQNNVEGYYAKLAYLYLTTSEANSYVRLHLTQKRGIGLGADHYYRLGSHHGEASIFFQPDEQAISGRARDTWQISRRVTSDLNLSLQRNSGYAGATQSLAGNLTFRRRGDTSNTTLGFDRSRTESTYSSSSRFTTNLSHRQRLPGDASWDLRAVLRRSRFGADRDPTETLETDLQFQDRGEWYDWAVGAERRWDFEGDASSSFGLDRLPEVVFNTDSRRLGNWKLLGKVPMRASVRAGHFVQYPDEEEVSTASLETNLGGGRTGLGESFTLTTTGTFDQAFYSDGSARYRVGTSMNLDGEFGSRWYSRLSHRFATVEGFSPLRRGYSGKYNDITFSAVRQDPNRSRFELTGGYDFQDERWRELRLRGWANASERDRLELVAGYSLDRAIWRPLQMRWTHAVPWDLYLALSSRYDLDDEKLTDADLEFDWRIDSRWRLEGLTTYSGYREELDEMNLRLTRDLHCWVANVTYNMELDEIRVNLGIKAFPFEDRDWTLGRGGARLGSYQQVYY